MRIASAVASTVLALLAGACAPPDDGRVQGYVEGEYVRVAAPIAGRLLQLEVARGATVATDAPLFALEREREQATVAEADESIAVTRAQAEQAQAAFQLAASNQKRLRELRAKGLASQEQVDAAQAEYRSADARRRELEAQRRTAGARLSQMQWQLTHKVVAAPVAGLVEDTYYQVGEWVPAGAPVVSLLPPENRLVRFFVPETARAALRPGQAVQVWRDGAAQPIAASISFIAPRAEFTPPVIYSREAREKLVFLVEARPAPGDAAALHPGQPVDVELPQ
jgi:HlyD family secretion protein